MGLVEVVTFGGMLLTSTALWVAVITYFNGKHVKRSQDHLEALLLSMNERFEKQHAETVAYLKQQGAMLEEWRREAAERSARQDAMLKEMQATLKEMQATLKEMQATLKEMQATLKEMQATTQAVQAGQVEIAKILERMDQRAEERHREVLGRLP